MYRRRRFDPYKNFKFRPKFTYPVPTRDSLPLPADEAAILDQIIEQGRRGAITDDRALFVGPGGTGKTLAAEVIANQLGRDLYRVDVSRIFSKYIGETEKNLRRIFDAAEMDGVVLFFDEADALFGKRSDVKDSHDRYANLEVSYLLQRIDAYEGVVIVATNRKTDLDEAFLRRMRFVIDFSTPGDDQGV